MAVCLSETQHADKEVVHSQWIGSWQPDRKRPCTSVQYRMAGSGNEVSEQGSSKTKAVLQDWALGIMVQTPATHSEVSGFDSWLHS